MVFRRIRLGWRSKRYRSLDGHRARLKPNGFFRQLLVTEFRHDPQGVIYGRSDRRSCVGLPSCSQVSVSAGSSPQSSAVPELVKLANT